MDKHTTLPGLTDCGSGYMRFEDADSPRLSNLEVAKKVGGFIGRRVKHISSNHYPGRKIHVLRFEKLTPGDFVSRNIDTIPNKKQ